MPVGCQLCSTQHTWNVLPERNAMTDTRFTTDARKTKRSSHQGSRTTLKRVCRRRPTATQLSTYTVVSLSPRCTIREAAYMERYRDSVHGCRIICNWSCTIGIWILLYHLPDDGAELIHLVSLLCGSRGGCREVMILRNLQSPRSGQGLTKYF